MKLYNGFTKEKWQRIKTDEYFAPLRSSTVTLAQKYISEPPAQIKFSEMHLFVTTGDRATYHRAIANLRSRIYTIFLAYMFTDDEAYIDPLCDAIWNFCDLESWALPAHVKEELPIDVRRSFVDISSSNAARRIAEIYAVMGDKLPPLVRRRIEYELRERIIRGYEDRDYHWKRVTNNWSAVCIAGVLGVYLYIATPEEIEAQLPAMQQTVGCFLDGFDDDGCCKEGYSYWLYGFKHFCLYAELIYNYTDGRINYFDMPKVHAIAKFQENMAINETDAVRFSDAKKEFKPDVALSHFLKNKYSDVQIPSLTVPESPMEFTEVLWIDPDLKDCKMNPESHIYHDSQWFIYRSEAYNFVCKAGSNNEPHNHNDVGSFMISKGGAVSFTDPGAGAYTRQYYSKTERYNVLEPSARAHSLPIINGIFQVKKDVKSTIYKEYEREYAFSMENGYEISTLKTLTRHFICEDSAVVLNDSFVFTEKPTSVVERFVTLIEPRVEKGRVFVENSILEYNPDLFDVSINTDICHRTGGVEEVLYMVDLCAKKTDTEMTFTFKFS